MKIHFNLRVCSQTSAQNIWYIRRCIYATHEMKSILVKMVGLPSQELLTAEWEGVERERPWLRPRGGSGTAQSIWSVQTQYAALWVLLKCVLQRISSSQSITCFSIVTLIFWFFFFIFYCFFFMASCCRCIGTYNTDQRFSFLREASLLEKLALDPQLVQSLLTWILPALSPILLRMQLQCFGQECPGIQCILGELVYHWILVRIQTGACV